MGFKLRMLVRIIATAQKPCPYWPRRRTGGRGFGRLKFWWWSGRNLPQLGRLLLADASAPLSLGGYYDLEWKAPPSPDKGRDSLSL